MAALVLLPPTWVTFRESLTISEPVLTPARATAVSACRDNAMLLMDKGVQTLLIQDSDGGQVEDIDSDSGKKLKGLQLGLYTEYFYFYFYFWLNMVTQQDNHGMAEHLPNHSRRSTLGPETQDWKGFPLNLSKGDSI